MAQIFRWLMAPFTASKLLKSFVTQDIRAQVAGSAGGMAWILIRPLSTLLLYGFIFSIILQLRIDLETVGTDSFTLYLLTGLIPWLAFSDAITRAPNLLIEKSNIIHKVHFPVEILPYSLTVTTFALNGIALIILLVFLAVSVGFNLAYAWLPLAIFNLFLFTLGLAALLSALGIFLRDIAQLIGITLPFIFYLTPILYPISMIPPNYQTIYQLNPLIPFVESFHAIMLLGVIPWEDLARSLTIGLLSCCCGGYVFMRMRIAFNDVL